MPAPREESAETLNVTRAIFNFESKCNMACRFCYVPFQRAVSTLGDWQAIVARVVELGARSIVFGGGDPLAFPDFRTLLRWMREALPAGIRIHVDTNGIGFTDGDKAVLALANSVGLPFDGATPEVHDAVRNYKGHFRIVLGVLQELVEAGFWLRINTVVTRENVSDLPALGTLLDRYEIGLWSLYEFWPTEPAASRGADRFGLRHEEFARAAEDVRQAVRRIPIDVRSIEDRVKPYLFVKDSGEAYTLDRHDVTRYAPLGSVFDAGLLARWRRIAPRSPGRGIPLGERTKQIFPDAL